MPLTMTMAEHDRCGERGDGSLQHEGRSLQRRIDLEVAGTKSSFEGSWPIHSSAAAVHPSQVGKAKEVDTQMGVKTDYDHKGKPIFRSASHRRKYLRAHRMFDKDGYD